MIRILATAIVAVAATLAGTASAEVKLKMLTAWDDRYPGTPLAGYQYGKNVVAASKGDIKFSYSGPEVVKPRQQFQPTSRGVFDVNLTVATYHLGTTSVMLTFFAMDPDPARWHKSGVWDFADKDFQKHGQKLLGIVTGGTRSNQFQLMLKRPYDQAAKLKGKKIRANAFYKPIVEPLGGAMVNLNGGEIYAALQRGVVDGAAWPVLGAVNFKWYEVAKHMSRPRFGVSVHSLAINHDRFRKLSAKDQATLVEEGRKIELSAPPQFDALIDKEIAELKKLGTKETHIDKATFAEIDRGFRKGIWDLAASMKASTGQVQKLRALARQKGLAD